MIRIGWRGEWRVRLDDNRPIDWPQKSPEIPKRAVMIVIAATKKMAWKEAMSIAPTGLHVSDVCCLSGYELPDV